MNAEQFQNSEERRARLYEIITDPVFAQAIAVLIDELNPDRANDGVPSPVVAAARFQQIAGATHVRRGLDRLTKLFVAPEETADEGTHSFRSRPSARGLIYRYLSYDTRRTHP
jgi:hypothetical protein